MVMMLVKCLAEQPSGERVQSKALSNAAGLKNIFARPFLGVCFVLVGAFVIWWRFPLL